MTAPKLIKIVDHCERLTRRQYDEDQGRRVAEEEFLSAFDEACRSIWKLTECDVDWDSVPEGTEPDYFQRENIWRDYAASRGYDLNSLILRKLVPWAERFVDMIRAEEHNAFANTPEKLAELRIKQEKEAFIENKRNGVIRG